LGSKNANICSTGIIFFKSSKRRSISSKHSGEFCKRGAITKSDAIWNECLIWLTILTEGMHMISGSSSRVSLASKWTRSEKRMRKEVKLHKNNSNKSWS
jgi:hypothetical protein